MTFLLLVLVASAAPPSEGKPRVLVMDLERADVDETTAKIVSGLVSSEVARLPVELVTAEDVRRIVELEGEKEELADCADRGACLAQLASAFGARFVVFGRIGKLGDLTTLQLSLFDQSEGKAVGREDFSVDRVEELESRVGPAVRRLFAVIAPAESESAWMLWAGGGAALVGAALAVIGFGAATAANGTLASATTSTEEKDGALESGPPMFALGVAGAVIAAAGGALFGVANVIE